MASEENEIVHCCYEILDRLGWVPVRQNKKWKGNTAYMRKGVADILCNCSGRYLAVECKMPEGKQSPEQKDFERLVKKKGGMYVIIRSKAEAYQLVEELRKLRLT